MCAIGSLLILSNILLTASAIVLVEIDFFFLGSRDQEFEDHRAGDKNHLGQTLEPHGIYRYRHK
jgi:hypothetical protein